MWGEVISNAEITCFSIPTDQPEESDGTATWDSTTVVLIQLSAGRTTGIGYSYSNEAATYVARDILQTVVIGQNAFNIPAVHSSMDRLVRNWGRPGLVSSAISAIDNCLWDLKARLLQQPILAVLGKAQDEIAFYGSGGFTSYNEKQLTEQLAGWCEQGMRAVKMKVGRDPSADHGRVKAAQRALQGHAELYVDANGAYRRKQARAMAEAFAEMAVRWFEEPVSSDDRVGLHRMVVSAPAAIEIAAGEYCYTLDDARLLMEANAVDVLQADATRCGGVSNFLKIGHSCELAHLPFSAHTAPSLHAPLCCALPAAINVEYFHDHARLEGMIFDGAVRPTNGSWKADSSGEGFGLTLKEKDADKYRVLSLKIESA